VDGEVELEVELEASVLDVPGVALLLLLVPAAPEMPVLLLEPGEVSGGVPALELLPGVAAPAGSRMASLALELELELVPMPELAPDRLVAAALVDGVIGCSRPESLALD
jgi:hypothetical protein